MQKNAYRIKGHESFILRDGWLNKGLYAVSQNPKLFSENNGADVLGVGTNMAKSIRYWLKAAELISESTKTGAVLTDYGNCIQINDPYLEDIFSLWIIHSNIVMNFPLATSWNVFFNNFKAVSFKRDEMISMMTDLLLDATEETSLPERSIKDDCAALLSMYSDGKDESDDPEDKQESPFSILGLIDQNGAKYDRTHPSMDDVDMMVVLYIILKNVPATEDGSKRSVLIDDLVEKDNMPGKVLGMSRIMINEKLDELARKGYIIVNRTAGLDIVYIKNELNELDALNVYFATKRSLDETI